MIAVILIVEYNRRQLRKSIMNFCIRPTSKSQENGVKAMNLISVNKKKIVWNR